MTVVLMKAVCWLGGRTPEMGYSGRGPPGSEGMGTSRETTSLALRAPGERDADLAWLPSQMRRRSANLKASRVIPDAELLPIVTARLGRAQRLCFTQERGPPPS